MVNAILLALLVLFSWTDNLSAQGLPVQTGSHVPVALWFIGVVVLGLVLAYGVMQNRKRTRADKQVTEQGTRDAYAREDRSGE
jgi:uncharacterized integral membrane protein